MTQHLQVNLNAVTDSLESGRTVLFVHSYPRSGNTWMRHLLADVLLQCAGHATQTKLSVHPDLIVPDLYSNKISDVDASIETPGLMLKTHEPFDRVIQFYNPTQAAQVKHVYIYRAPEDVLVSYYHYHLRYDGLKAQAAEGVDAFCLGKLQDWANHVASFIQARNTGHEVKLVAYESMLSDAKSILKSVCDWFGIPANEGMIHRAVSNMEFKNLRAKEEENPMNKSEFFFRKGIKGSGAQELAPSTLQTLQTVGEDLLKNI